MENRLCESINCCIAEQSDIETPNYSVLSFRNTFGPCEFSSKPEAYIRQEFEDCGLCKGRCCLNGPCGPWLPCDLIDTTSERVDRDTLNPIDIKDLPYIPHDLDWERIKKLIETDSAIIVRNSYQGDTKYSLGIPTVHDITEEKSTVVLY